MSTSYFEGAPPLTSPSSECVYTPPLGTYTHPSGAHTPRLPNVLQ